MEDVLSQTLRIMKSNDVSGRWNEREARHRIRSIITSQAKRVTSPAELAITIRKCVKEPDNLFVLSEYFGINLISILKVTEEAENSSIGRQHKVAISSLMSRHRESQVKSSTWFVLQRASKSGGELFAHVFHTFDRIANLARASGFKDRSEEFAATAIGLDDLSFYKSLLEGPQMPIPDIALRAGLKWGPYTALKRMINSEVVLAFRQVFALGLVKVLETCQGVGDGTHSYLKTPNTTAIVLSTEKDKINREHAALKVPHIEYPSEADPSSFPFGHPLLGSSFEDFSNETLKSWGNQYLSIMPPAAQKCHAFMRKLDELSPSWTFNVLDVDPYGFPESSELNVLDLTKRLDDLAVIALSNGLTSDRYQVPGLSMFTMFCKYATSLIRGELATHQRKVIFSDLPHFEMAFRVLSFQEEGLNLIPILLFDYRTKQGGLVRTYYLVFRKTSSLLEIGIRKIMSERVGLPYIQIGCFFKIESGKELKLPYDKIPFLVPQQIFDSDPPEEELVVLSRMVGSLVKQRMAHIRDRIHWR